jgi:hypothetical protein
MIEDVKVEGGQVSFTPRPDDLGVPAQGADRG